MAKTITTFPATRNMYTTAPIAAAVKRRVAGYARVSTDSDEQFTSYEAQIDYYTNFIRAKPEWEFVKVYTDEGISATNTRHRDGFNEMIADALAGKIDLIVTKSVSRFARNTVDSLTTIRKLKKHGVECFFEKESIWTFDGKGELLITIMSSLAQEESRSISENVTWGQRKRFADGKFSVAYSRFLGYEKGENGEMEIVEEQAAVVRLIFRLFMDGRTPGGIAKYLTDENIPTPGGKKCWNASTILSILTNEKYKGDALLQKAFTVDFLTKAVKKNEGEVPQYYVTGSHPAIIPPGEFDLVQEEIARRKQAGRYYSGRGVLASKLVCGDCGAFYGQKVWHSTDRYRTVVYHCNRKFDNERRCKTPTLREQEIRDAFLEAYSQLMEKRDEILKNCRDLKKSLTDNAELLEEQTRLEEEMTLITELSRQLIQSHAHQKTDAETFLLKKMQYDKRLGAAQDRLNAVVGEMEKNKVREREIQRFIQDMEKQPLVLTEWDEQLWNQIVQTVTAYRDRRLEFSFHGGMVISIALD